MTTPKIILTQDGSHTLIDTRTGETYHSIHGAIQESEHVFIRAGLDLFCNSASAIHVFEVGFGSGLNALLTYLWAEKNKIPVQYQSIELYPISFETVTQLNYPQLLKVDKQLFQKMHQHREEEIIVSGYFTLQKHLKSLDEIRFPDNTFFDVVFFDAFSPSVLPEMWTEQTFGKIACSMKNGGVLTTYSTKGDVKRALKASGFTIEKLPGPPGKREILRAIKKR